jgi:hypothetical protein
MTAATRELLAARADVWGFLAEPYHLSDWWPGIVSVEPDHRGFAPGARWQVQVVADPIRIWVIRFPRAGRPSGPTGRQVLVIGEIAPLERWTFQLFRRVTAEGGRAARPRLVEISLRALAADRTEVAIVATTGTTPEPRLAQTAADRLYDLIQTAAAM